MARRRFRRKKKKVAQPASGAVLGLLKKLGLTDQARRIKISAAWGQAVGPEIAARTEPMSFRRGVLVVKSASAAWQNELTFLKDEILEKVNAALGGKQTVRELKVVSGALAKPKPEPPPAWVTASPTPDDLDAARDASQPIDDPDLKRLFEQVMLVDRRARRVRGE